MLTRTLRSERGEIRYFISRPSRASSGCVIFTHGLGTDHTVFDSQLDAVTGRFDTLTWDIPLHGASRPYEGFSLYAAADELLAIIEGECLPTPAVLVGHSCGAHINRVFAAAHPELARCLVEISSLPPGAENYSRAELFLLRRTEAAASAVPFRSFCAQFAGRTCLTPIAADRVRTAMIRLGRTGLLTAIRGYRGALTALPAPGAPQCPVLTVAGENDRMPLVKTHALRTASAEGHSLAVLSRAGHYPHCDASDAFNAALLGFIEQHQPGGSLPEPSPVTSGVSGQ